MLSSSDLERLFKPSQALLDAMASIATVAESFRTIHIPDNEKVIESVRSALTVSDRLSETYRGVFESINRQTEVFGRLSLEIAAASAVQTDLTRFSEAAHAWDMVSADLAQKMQSIGIFDREYLPGRLLAGSSTYAVFVEQTTRRIVNSPNESTRHLLQESLDATRRQYVSNAYVLSEFIAAPSDVDAPLSLRELAVPAIQQEILLSKGTTASTSGIEARVEKSRRVLQLITKCNEAVKTSQAGSEVFKPTTRLLEVFTDLPWLASTEKRGFGDFVDCLYFALYEGAGKDKLRFLNDYGGPLTKEECGFIWHIKHLRNKWLRHDADHGKESDIRKTWNELSQSMQEIGIARFPTAPNDFEEAQDALLDGAFEFLELLLKRYTAF